MSLVCVYRGSGPTDAYLIRHLLESLDIHVHVRGDLVSLRGEIPIGEAWPSVWVAAEDQPQAEDAIRRFHGPKLVHPRWKCSACGETNEATFEWCWQCGAEPSP